MRNFKKVVALVLAVALAMSTWTVAFAAEPTSADKLVTLGLLSDASATSLSAGLTREIGLTMILKDLGYTQADADKAAAAPFTDTKGWVVKWANLAYEKGITKGVTATTFGGSAKITGDQFLTLALRGLGVTVAKTSEAVATAITAGLLPAGSTLPATFTKGDAANIMFATLTFADPTTKVTLLDSLIAKGVVTTANAVAAGLKAAETVKADSVVAVTNKIVDVKILEANALKGTPAVSEFAIKDAKGAAVAISALAVMDSGKTVRLTTDAQVAGALYTLTVNGVSKTFVGLAADTTKPVVSTVVATSNTTVEVTFEKADTAVNVANYTINDLTVTAASIDGAKVTLTTSAQTSGKLYTLTMDKVADLSGNVMDKVEKKFGGRAADTTKPVVATAVAKTNTTVEVTFTEIEKMGASATDIANYTFDNGLTVTKAEFVKDSNVANGTPKVTLTTSAQTSGKLYTLTVQNVKDVAGNTADKTEKKLGGLAADTTKPVVASAIAKTNTTIEVTFTEVEKLADSALDLANFAITDLTITKAEFKKDTNVVAGTPVVVLTTSAQTSGKLYTLTVQNVKDVAGNTIDKVDKKLGGLAADTTKPKLTAAQALTQTSVKLTFNESLDEASAEELGNYTIDGALGYPTAAVYDDATLTVTLTTLAQTAKSYKVTVANVKDASGNVIDADNDEKSFSGIGAALDKLKVEGAYAIDKNTVKVMFNQAVKENANNANSALREANYTLTGNGALVGDTAADSAYTADDGKSVILTFADAMTNTDVLTIAVAATVVGKYDAAIDTEKDEAQFAGLSTNPADITLDLVNVIDADTIQLVFSGNVKSAGFDETKVQLFATEAAVNDAGAAAVALGQAGADVIKDNKVTLNLSAPLTSTTVYYLNLAAGHALTNLATVNTIKIDTAAAKAETVFATAAISAIELKVDAAIMVDVNTLEVYFNQNIADVNTVDDHITILTSADVNTTAAVNGVYAIDGKKLTVYSTDLGTKTTAGVVYKVVFGTLTDVSYANGAINIKDTSSNKAEFAAVDTENAQPAMTGASALGDSVVKVDLNEAITAAGAINSSDFAVVNKATGVTLATADYTVAYTAGDKFFTITTAAKFATGTEYEIYAVTGTDVTDVAGIGAIKKDANDGGDRENSVKFTGSGTVALTLVAAQFTLTFGANNAADQIAASATAGLAASTTYTFKLVGTTAATVTSEVEATQADKSLTAVQFGGASVLGVTGNGGNALTIEVYDLAGNLVGSVAVAAAAVL